MFAAVRPFATAGVALIGAGVLVITPIAPPPPDVYIANPAPRLTAASQFPGAIAALANLPANEIAALTALALAFQDNGPLACYPNCAADNLLGWEPGFDEEFGRALVAVLVPFPALAGPLAAQLNAVLLRELPINPEACAAIPTPCADPGGLFSSWWTIPPWQLIADGTVNPTALIAGLIATLTTPAAIMPTPSIQDVITTFQAVSAGLALFVSLPFLATLPASFPQLVADFATFFGNFAQPSSAPMSATSIPAPNPGQTFSIDVAPGPPGGDITNDGVASRQLAPTNAEQGSGADAGLTTPAPSSPAGAPSTVSQTVSQSVAPDAGQGVGITSTPTQAPKPTVTSTDVMSGGNKVEPGQAGGNDTTSSGGGLNSVVNSVTGQITSTITHVTGGLTGGGSPTGEAATSGAGE